VIILKNIVVVGGGAGGLELVTKLAAKFKRTKAFKVILIDRNSTHLWKPLLHEVATGATDSSQDELDYRFHGYNKHYEFQLGSMEAIDRDQQQLILAPIYDENGNLLVDTRRIDYHTLVIAVGSVTNDFGIKGVKEHCAFLDQPRQATLFHQQLLAGYLKNATALQHDPEAKLNIAIVGAGATGVELSAELHNSAKELSSYGVNPAAATQLHVTLIEAGPSILPALPERISKAAKRELELLGVKVLENTQITECDANGMLTKEGLKIEAQLMVWAAGIKAAAFLKDIAGLETNPRNQLVVKPSLQTSRDDNIFALGDCAACILPNSETPVPPRAQAAHQMATHIYKNILLTQRKKPLRDYQYRDYGSLISLSRYSTVGSLMGSLSGKSLMIEGFIARIVYISLYRMHLIAIHGWVQTTLIVFQARIQKLIKPKLKMH
jgi:NADH dehydrogenase